MFNDKYGLTQAVLDGRKTMTRRTFYIPDKLALKYYVETDNLVICETQYNGNVIEWRDSNDNVRMTFQPKYEVGEVVAIAQSYKDIGYNGEYSWVQDGIHYHRDRAAGWANKMFVKVNLMPHHIKITDIKVERLQDISDKDCFKEGIYASNSFEIGYGIPWVYEFAKSKMAYYTPREAFAALINKVSGKGTWESNPFVWVYEFKLLD